MPWTARVLFAALNEPKSRPIRVTLTIAKGHASAPPARISRDPYPAMNPSPSHGLYLFTVDLGAARRGGCVAGVVRGQVKAALLDFPKPSIDSRKVPGAYVCQADGW